ncbi:MAG: vWA domain-containing protein, partial [Pseudomonadota bacterium]
MNWTLLLFLPLFILWWLWLWPARTGRWLRLFILFLAALALADIRWWGETDLRHITLLVDRSLSTDGKALEEARTLTTLIQQRETDQVLHVVGFGRGAGILLRPGDTLDSLNSLTSQDESDLAAGLQLTTALSPSIGHHEVLLISDGLYTGADPLSEIPTLRKQGIRLHYLPIQQSQQSDAAITRIIAPTRVTAGQPFALAAEVFSPTAQSATLQLKHPNSGQILNESDIQLNPGQNRFSLNWAVTRNGLQEYALAIKLDNDAQPQNNQARVALDVVGPPGVLHIAPTQKNSALAEALRSSGLAVDTRAADTELNSALLKHYAALVLENVSLEQLGDDADTAVAHYVRHLGGGLLVTGGRNSYAMGGYYRSYLEDILPITLDRQEQLRRQRVAVAIVLDRSGSMGVDVEGGATKMDLANRGAAEALSLLTPLDEVAVFAVDSEAHTVLPRQQIGDLETRRQLANRVLSIESAGGGIFVYVGLSTAVEALLVSDANTRHIVLFSDAADSEQPGDYESLIRSWQAAGGSVSVIGLGTEEDVDANLLKHIAELGKGRAYFTANALKLPRIFVQDMMHVARDSFIDTPTPVQSARGLLTLEFTTSAIPNVGGYNLGYLAQGADLMMLSQDDNQAPLAAGWQRGQGRVVAVAFEADGPFTGDMRTWAEYKRFFRHALEWLKRPPFESPHIADLTLQGRRAVVTLTTAPGERLTSTPEALIIMPGATEPTRLPLSWQRPDVLRGEFLMQSDGIYHGAIQLHDGPPLLLPPRVLPYSPEFQPRDPVTVETMPELAKVTGGQLFSHLEQLYEKPVSQRMA